MKKHRVKKIKPGEVCTKYYQIDTLVKDCRYIILEGGGGNVFLRLKIVGHAIIMWSVIVICVRTKGINELKKQIQMLT